MKEVPIRIPKKFEEKIEEISQLTLLQIIEKFYNCWIARYSVRYFDVRTEKTLQYEVSANQIDGGDFEILGNPLGIRCLIGIPSDFDFLFFLDHDENYYAYPLHTYPRNHVLTGLKKKLTSEEKIQYKDQFECLYILEFLHQRKDIEKEIVESLQYCKFEEIKPETSKSVLESLIYNKYLSEEFDPFMLEEQGGVPYESAHECAGNYLEGEMTEEEIQNLIYGGYLPPNFLEEVDIWALD